MATVKVRAPIDPAQKVSFVSLLENIEVEPARPRAKVVVNARTGTIVIGGDVRVSAAAVTHGSLTVRVKEDVNITQTQAMAVANGVAATAPGAAVETPDTTITMVPVRALTTTLARGRAGSTSIFSRRLTNETFCAGSIGARTLTVVESSGTATPPPRA